jgi:hypothetical protein
MAIRFALALLALALPLAAGAGPWEFEAPISLSDRHGEKLFHHLESSGRRNIAVSGDTVAVAWEDDRDGTPRIYLARRRLQDKAFAPALRLSGEGEAYEPSLVALDGGRFAAAWEEDGRVRLRLVTPEGGGPVATLEAAESAQPSLLYAAGELLLVAAEREKRFARIRFHRFAVDEGRRLHRLGGCAVDAALPQDEQLYPTLAQQQGVTVVAWEDRRPGHTIIMAGESVPGSECAFTVPRRISLRPERGEKMPYGRGHGVARVALAAYGKEALLAAWADKRDFREGYDIYAAHWRPQRGFDGNERVQDAFGGVARQWHTAVAGDSEGRLVVAWDDERDGDGNVMYSWLEAGEWSEDLPLPGADGAGEQTHPAITLDAQGNLHAAWVERDVVGGPTRLRYAFGSLRGSE